MTHHVTTPQRLRSSLRAGRIPNIPRGLAFRARRTIARTRTRLHDRAEAPLLRARLPWLDGLDLARYRRELEPMYRDYLGVSSEEMAISLQTAAFLAALCEHLTPDSIIDLGSGFSSAVVRRFAATCAGDVPVVSVDDSPEWLEATARFLRAHQLPDNDLVTWAEVLASPPTPAQLVVHDLGPMALRAQALGDVSRLTAPGGITVFDDMHHYGDLVRARAPELGYEAVLSARTYTLDLLTRYAAIGFRGRT